MITVRYFVKRVASLQITKLITWREGGSKKIGYVTKFIKNIFGLPNQTADGNWDSRIYLLFEGDVKRLDWMIFIFYTQVSIEQ